MKLREKDARKLAAAVISLFDLQSRGDEWTDADECLNDAAFLLLDRSLVSYMDFGLYMVEAGGDIDAATNLIDVPVEQLRRYIQCGGQYA